MVGLIENNCVSGMVVPNIILITVGTTLLVLGTTIMNHA